MKLTTEIYNNLAYIKFKKSISYNIHKKKKLK